MYMGIIYMISRARGYSAEALFSSEFHKVGTRSLLRHYYPTFVLRLAVLDVTAFACDHGMLS